MKNMNWIEKILFGFAVLGLSWVVFSTCRAFYIQGLDGWYLFMNYLKGVYADRPEWFKTLEVLFGLIVLGFAMKAWADWVAEDLHW